MCGGGGGGGGGALISRLNVRNPKDSEMSCAAIVIDTEPIWRRRTGLDMNYIVEEIDEQIGRGNERYSK